MKVLVGAPIKQEPEILNYYLKSLENLNHEGIEMHYCFIDDNDDQNSKKLLQDFSKKNTVKIIKSEKNETYIKTNDTHHWKEKLIWNVAEFKNKIIKHAVTEKYDYLLFVDSDLILHKETLKQLIKANKDIVSNIFWTKWTQESKVELPQVWISDTYTLYEKRRDEAISQEEANRRTFAFIEKLRVPGVYEVGGLGALTLIKREALEKGANFSEIKNLSLWGEDRHFCVRANALGIKLHVDTHYPAFHIYRNEDLQRLKNGEVMI